MKDKLHTQELYLPNGDEVMGPQIECLEKLYEYNLTRPFEGKKRTTIKRNVR